MEDDRAFLCPMNECGMKFDSEDNLEAHKKKHDLSLSLTPTPTLKTSLFDHTPTPTRFLKDLDSELFQEIHENPFDATFRRANSLVAISGQIPVPESSALFSSFPDTEPLNTPSITLMNEPEISVGTSRNETSVILHNKSSEKPGQSQNLDETSQTLPFSPSAPFPSGKESDGTLAKRPAHGAEKEEESGSEPSPSSSSSSSSSSSASLSVQDSSVTSATCEQLKDQGSEALSQSAVVQTPVITSVGNLSKTSATCVPTAVVVTRCTTSDVPSLSSSVSQMSVVTESSKTLITDQPLLQGIAVTPVVQLIIRLPDGQSMPVKIPMVTLTQPAVTTVTQPVTVASNCSKPQSLVKQKLKEVLSVPQRNAQGSNCTISTSTATSTTASAVTTQKLPLPSAVRISSCLDNSLSESPPSSPHNVRTTGGRRRREAIEDPETKRKKSLERNRAAATRCRQKRKQWIQQLEKKADELHETNKLLQNEVTMLRNEVATLKTMLLAHKDCPVTQQQKACGFPQVTVQTTQLPLSHSPASEHLVNGMSDSPIPEAMDTMDTESSSSQCSSVSSVRVNYIITNGNSNSSNSCADVLQ